MEKFDLEKALVGEPVVLRNGNKAFVKFVLENPIFEDDQVVGFHINGEGKEEAINWRKDGIHIPNVNSIYDITGMYEEPRPAVTLTLPCPLLKPQKDMWFISSTGRLVRSDYGYNPDTTDLSYNLNEMFYFATEEDAQAWLNAMRESRR